MTRLLTAILTSLALLVSVPAVRAQLSTIAVVDFEKAVVESVEGKKSSDKFNATLQARQGEAEKRQKELEDQQRKLQTGARTLSDAAKAEIQRDIDRRTTEMQRRNEDAQKELQALRDELLRPIAERATAILNAMAAEQGYTIVVDLSNQENGVVWFNPKNDITAELIKRIDASTAKEAPKPTGAAPTTTKPPVTAAPKPTTPAPPVTPKQ
jgi:Skp family chaperone for outer membrane proteins